MPYHLSEQDVYLFHQGTHFQSYHFLGCHEMTWKDEQGFRFVVWAPNASLVSLVGEFNQWNGASDYLHKINNQGLWSGFFTNIPENSPYKFEITHSSGQRQLKSDPFARQSELRPATASLTPLLKTKTFAWGDQKWLKEKSNKDYFKSPINIYEVHLGTWKSNAKELRENEAIKLQMVDNELFSYRKFADEIIPYLKKLAYTHIELMPIAEHPFDPSWGYQITGYYSVTSRYGSPDDFKYLVNQCHKNQIGVILDWVPGHFCKDDHGLRQFDGEPVYEYSDRRKANKTSWGTLAFDFGKPEVQSFLISNALYWLNEYHVDGIRVDAVASMIYLNFDKLDDEERIYNSYGGEENLEALAFIKKLNQVVIENHPNALMIAEDSSDLPLVTASTSVGGLGFTFKWNMGWMNDMLEYMKIDPLYRKWQHNLLTFSFMYSHSENFILPLSHDEVVHGKKSLLNKMPGDQWRQFANLRLLYGYMFAHPGKKLLFMGGELGQYAEWKDKEQLDWHLLDFSFHESLSLYVKELNHFYQSEPAMYELDHDQRGFQWIDANNIDQSTIVFLRRGITNEKELIIISNFTPNVHYDYKVGVPSAGLYKEIFNSDSKRYGGSNQLNEGEHFSFPEKWHNCHQHIKVMVPPLAITIFNRIDTNQIEEEYK